MFSQTVAEKLVEDQEIDSPEMLASLSDDGITLMMLLEGLMTKSAGEHKTAGTKFLCW